jgi:hypothetical protein
VTEPDNPLVTYLATITDYKGVIDVQFIERDHKVTLVFIDIQSLGKKLKFYYKLKGAFSELNQDFPERLLNQVAINVGGENLTVSMPVSAYEALTGQKLAHGMVR